MTDVTTKLHPTICAIYMGGKKEWQLQTHVFHWLSCLNSLKVCDFVAQKLLIANLYPSYAQGHINFLYFVKY